MSEQANSQFWRAIQAVKEQAQLLQAFSHGMFLKPVGLDGAVDELMQRVTHLETLAGHLPKAG